MPYLIPFVIFRVEIVPLFQYPSPFASKRNDCKGATDARLLVDRAPASAPWRGAWNTRIAENACAGAIGSR
jgi:hypothetical protein